MLHVSAQAKVREYESKMINDLTKKQYRTIHTEAMKSCTCIASYPANQRCTVGGWIRCNGTQAASRDLEMQLRALLEAR